MMASRIRDFPRISKNCISQFRHYAVFRQHLLPSRSDYPFSRQESATSFDKGIPRQKILLHHPFLQLHLAQLGFSFYASAQPTDKEHNQSSNEQATVSQNDGTSEDISQGDRDAEQINESADSTVSEKLEESSARSEPKLFKTRSARRSSSHNKRTAFSDSDEEEDLEDLSVDALVKLVAEKEVLLNTKQKEVEKMQEKVLRSYADMENVIERTRRESDNSKKFAIQNFAKSLLDVADNLGRASSVGKDSLSKIELSKESGEAAKRLKELLEGVEMTVKQLAEVLKKFGVEKYDALNEQFDPNRHYAVVQMHDASKPPGTVSAVLKTGYVLHDRIIRPAEVVVVSQQE